MSTLAVTPHSFGTGSSRAAAGHVETLAARPARLRLTGRGRAVLLALVAVPITVWLLLAQLNGGAATGTLESGAPVPIVVVESGESLWSVAERVAPGSDPRDVIEAIVAFNHLGSFDVMAGQQLGIPAPYAG